MIAYEELAAALERWRIRNGLPGTPPLFADGPRPSVSASPYAQAAAPVAAAASFAPVSAPMAAPVAPPAPRTAPPGPPPAAETIDEDLADADVLDEDHLDNDGPDFSVGFGGATAAPTGRAPQVARPGMTADDERESTIMGGTDPGLVPPPGDVWPEAANYAPSDATAAASYGWGEDGSSRPAAPPARDPALDDDDDDDGGGGTLVQG